jgi:hypothetical protein
MIIKNFLQYEAVSIFNNIYYSKGIAGIISFVVVSVFFSSAFDSYSSYFNYLLASSNLFLLLLVSFFISFHIHEMGHYLWGFLAGGKVKFFLNINNCYIARLTNFTKTSLIMFSLGGPLTNILFAAIFIVLLQNNPVLVIDQLLFVLAFLNFICGFGALIPNSPNRGGLLYYKYIFQYDKIIREERSNQEL